MKMGSNTSTKALILKGLFPVRFPGIFYHASPPLMLIELNYVFRTLFFGGNELKAK